MAGAVAEYQRKVEGDDKGTLRMIERVWNVQKSIQRRVKEVVRGCNHAAGVKPILSTEVEELLAQLIGILSQRGFPLQKERSFGCLPSSMQCSME